jgi:hypothetical protein
MHRITSAHAGSTRNGALSINRSWRKVGCDANRRVKYDDGFVKASQEAMKHIDRGRKHTWSDIDASPRGSRVRAGSKGMCDAFPGIS